MISTVPLLTPEQCNKIVDALKDEWWLPGVAPSDAYAKKVKRNKEIPMGGNSEVDELQKWVIDRILESQFFKARTLPKNLGRPRFNLCEEGGEYGWHADSAFMGANPEIRTDVSVSLFLTPPESYEGGELELRPVSGQSMGVKGAQGTMVFYPSGVMHRVTPVTSGRRICFICWIESHIQSTQKRDLLVEISELCNMMEGEDHLSDIHTRMLNVKHNLFRQWMKLT